jgi:2-hydroxychromene-2-carboxylate isomerase
MPTLDFWFDFASTYSYPPAMRIARWRPRRVSPCANRPFLLGPIFKAQRWDTSLFNIYEAKGRHMWRDLERLCADLALPFRRPEVFPQPSPLAARVALIGLGDNWGEAFRRAVFRAQLADGRRIDDLAVIGGILAGLKRDPTTALEAAQAESNKQLLRQQTDDAQRLGIFGAPTFVTADGESFWANDRLERALQWARREVICLCMILSENRFPLFGIMH